MNLPVHIFLKDLRRFWILAVIVVAFIGIEILGSYLNIVGGTSWQLVSGLAQNGPLLVEFILAVAIMQADLTVGDRGFWRTRPIGAASLYLGKLVFFLAVLVLPAVAANLYLAVLMRTPFATGLGIVLESTGTILDVALLAALMASVTRTMVQAVTLTFAFALAMALAGPFFADQAKAWNLAMPWGTDVTYPGPRIAAFGLYFGVALLALLAHQVLTLRHVRTVAFFAVSIPLALVCAGRWPIEFHPVTGTVDKPARLENSIGLRVMMRPPVDVRGSTYFRDTSTHHDVLAYGASMEVSLGGVPLGRIVELDSIRSTLRLGDGPALELPPTGKQAWPFWSSAVERAAICRTLGIAHPPFPDEKEESRRLSLFSITPEQGVPFEMRPATYAGVMVFNEIAFHEETRLAARAGATSSSGGQVWRLATLEEEKDGLLTAGLRFLVATTIFVPDGPARTGYPWAIRRGFVMMNHSRGEYSLASNTWGSWEPATGPLWAMRRFARFGKRFHNDGSPAGDSIDAAWLGGADLVVLAAQPIGKFEKHVALEGFVLPELPVNKQFERAPFWQ
jgi:hypothetical protein